MAEQNDASSENDKAVEDLKKSAEVKDREIAELKKRVEDEKQLNQIHLTMIRELQAQLTSQSRLGLIIAKKNISTAVQRNRVKRVARETFRQKEFSVVMDIVLLARTGANRLSNEQLTQALNTAWSHLDARSQQQRVKHA